MSTDYYVLVNDVQIDEICISTTGAFEDMKPWNDFIKTLTNEERMVISLVDEYSYEFDDSDCFDGDFHSTRENTDLENLVISKYNTFFGIDDEQDEIQDDREICPFCNTLTHLYAIPRRPLLNPMFSCCKCINEHKVDHLFLI